MSLTHCIDCGDSIFHFDPHEIRCIVCHDKHKKGEVMADQKERGVKPIDYTKYGK